MRGFTLLEIIIVVAIVSVVGAIGIISTRSFQQYADIDAAANQIVAVLREARDRTAATDFAVVYGVHFESDRYIRFQGPAYNENATTNVIYNLPASLELYEINVGGDSEILFNSLDGSADRAGSTSMRIIDNPAESRTINIFSTGVIGIAGMDLPAGSRITDSRHVHFDLGWSIKTSSALTLRFSNPPNPDVVENISVAAHMNADQTNFDWSGSVSVGGESQLLRIHTHALTDFDTILSVHRDRRFNTKAVEISIDGQDIASYDSDGEVTVGFFGGAMEIQ